MVGIGVNVRKLWCIECVKVVLVFFFDKVEVGDYIVFFGVVYDYYVIIILKL